jgi:hypothetical protein
MYRESDAYVFNNLDPLPFFENYGKHGRHGNK